MDNQRLKKLGLGKAHDANCDGIPEIIITNDKYDFLEKLCQQYASCEGTVPLNLQTLRLGHGMFITSMKESHGENWLKKLVKLDKLQTLHIFNSLLQDYEDGDVTETIIDWRRLEDCKSICQLSVSRISADVIDWLLQNGKTVQELLVTDHYNMRDSEGMGRFSTLNLPRLSMLYVREMWIEKTTDEDDWEDTDMDASDSDDLANVPVNFDSSEQESSQSTPDLADSSLSTVLDRLPDGGLHLTRLALCIIFEDQGVGKIVSSYFL